MVAIEFLKININIVNRVICNFKAFHTGDENIFQKQLKLTFKGSAK